MPLVCATIRRLTFKSAAYVREKSDRVLSTEKTAAKELILRNFAVKLTLK